jgi:Domain of unknown function (DUF4388)/Tetratricopeptide repeat
VIPTADLLHDIAHRPEGSLAEVPFAVLLLALAVHGRTAVVEMTRRQVNKRMVLEAGVPVDCRSNLAQETLGRYMVGQGKLSEIDFTTCLGKSAARGVPLGEVLLEQELIGPFELFRILQQNLAHKLLDLFTWREGEVRLHTDVPPLESSLKVKVPQLIVTGITKLAPQEEVDAAIAPLVGKKLVLHPAPFFPLAEVRLPPRQAPLLEALRHGPRIDQLAEATRLPPEEITRLLYALAVIGTVTSADQLPRFATGVIQIPPAALRPADPAPPQAAAPAPAAPAPTAPAPTAPAPTAPAMASPTAAPLAVPAVPAPIPPAPATPLPDPTRLRDEVMQAYLSYRKQDPFDLLAVPEEAKPAEIDERFLAFAERWSPARFAGFPELVEKARDLLLAGARGYGQLAERESRDTLLFRRRTLRDEKARRPAPDFGIKTDLLDPEVQYRKGRAALDAGRPKEAMQLFEFAADCDPQNGLYRAEVAWARFLHSPAFARKSVADLHEALRVDPRCGLAHYYLGEIQGELGDWNDAEASLQKAIKLMAPDRRPIEALKGLQGKRKR